MSFKRLMQVHTPAQIFLDLIDMEGVNRIPPPLSNTTPLLSLNGHKHKGGDV